MVYNCPFRSMNLHNFRKIVPSLSDPQHDVNKFFRKNELNDSKVDPCTSTVEDCRAIFFVTNLQHLKYRRFFSSKTQSRSRFIYTAAKSITIKWNNSKIVLHIQHTLLAENDVKVVRRRASPATGAKRGKWLQSVSNRRSTPIVVRGCSWPLCQRMRHDFSSQTPRKCSPKFLMLILRTKNEILSETVHNHRWA